MMAWLACAQTESVAPGNEAYFPQVAEGICAQFPGDR